MNMAKGGLLRTGLAAAAVWLALAGAPEAPRAQSSGADIEALADRIAAALGRLEDPRYKTMAFSRIKQEGSRLNVEELIDFANVKIVRERRLRVVDRSKLELVLREQKVHLSDFVSAQKYQELGKIIGVDLFMYGTIYRDALVLKAIDVQNSAIAWAEVFPLTDQPGQGHVLEQLGDGVVNSLRGDLERLRKAKIRQVSFWDLDTVAGLSREALMDYLSVAITQDGNLLVVDRENLKLIGEEQKLSQAMFIDEASAKRLGELYGVDAFIYGGISRRDQTYVASLKMMNIFNGVIEWADLIKVTPGADGQGQSAGAPGPGAGEMVLVGAGPFTMGSNGGPPEAAPARRINLQKPYRIDRFEVSNAEYARFVKARKHRRPYYWKSDAPPPGEENFPVVGVTWDDARRYCRDAGRRLPTEAEWEKAARGAEGQPFPWPGTGFEPSYTVTRESNRKAPVAVDSATRDVSPYGARFMGGNVREWVLDAFAPYTPSSPRHPAYGKGERVVRGGSWATPHTAARTFARGSSNPNLVWPDVGFRCAELVEP